MITPGRLIDRLITILGDLKVFPWPMFLIYDPGGYQLKGPAMREVMRRVQPGDILLRGYRHYLDSYFIPGYFNHAGLYLGWVGERDVERVELDGGRKRFRAGEQMVIHALAEGVVMEDLLNFCRCDYMAILRFPGVLKANGMVQPGGTERLRWMVEEVQIANRLQAGQLITFRDAFPTIFDVALRNLGRPYDFRFDFEDFQRLCCTEFVHFCTKSLEPFLGIRPTRKRVLLVPKTMIAPDAFLQSRLRLEWLSPSVDEGKVRAIRESESDSQESRAVA